MVLAAKILAVAAVSEGMFVTAFPEFGPERRGAPVTAFLRLSDDPIRLRTKVYSPDCLVIMDNSERALRQAFNDLRTCDVAVVNSGKKLLDVFPGLKCMGSVDATAIGLAETGRPVVNTCMLGAFARTTGWVQLESVLAAIEQLLDREQGRINARCAQRGFHEVLVVDLKESVTVEFPQ